MRASLCAVHIHVPRGARQRGHHPVQLARHLNLAPQPARVLQPKREVEHVVLLVFGFGQEGVVLWGDDDMARRARQRFLACSLEVDVVLVCQAEYVVPLTRFDRLDIVALAIAEGQLDAGARSRPDELAVAQDCRGVQLAGCRVGDC